MELIQNQLIKAKKARESISKLSDGTKQSIICRIADLIVEEKGKIMSENFKDLEKMSPDDPKRDRLLLTDERITDLSKSLNVVAGLPDPTGKLISETILTNGLSVSKKTVALGVVGVIYESRPNVTLDVAALCIRSGNVCLLRGGQDAHYTNQYLVSLIQKVLASLDLDVNIVTQWPGDRKYMLDFLQAEKYIDVIIPRGSSQLIEYVRKHSLVPVIETGAGVCHTYVEKSADLDMAAKIVVNAKVSRPSVCNSLDTILVDSDVAMALIEKLVPLLANYKVEIFADPESAIMLTKLNYPFVSQATQEDYGREFLDFKCSLKIVSNITEALDHISEFSSKHSEAIITTDAVASEIFLDQVDAAAVYLNASTRFTDGQVFGLGAEIGISTQKLHARGPFALEKLVTEKWTVRGEGQIR